MDSKKKKYSDSSGRKESDRSKRLDNPRFSRPKQDPVTLAHALIAGNSQEKAQSLAERIVYNLTELVKEGDLPGYATGKDIRRSLGFWKSVAGYLARKKKDLKKAAT